MAFYIIAGQKNCPHFLHALQIANYLYERLPNFEVFKIEKDPEEYLIWLKKLNKERGWHHMSSPLVWKEVSMKGGHPYIIGGLSEFWEYIYDYYGLKTTLTKEDIEALMKEIQMFDQEDLEKKRKLLENSVNISISAKFQHRVYLFIWQLFHETVGLKKKHLTFKLYDNNLDNETEGEILNFIDEFENMVLCTPEEEKKKMQIVYSLESAIKDCDLFIIFDEYERRSPEEPDYNYYRRGVFEMGYIADQINLYAKRTLRVILAQSNLVCLNATVLLHRCTTIKLTNIVALTADLGLTALEVTSKKCPIELEKACGPPVWGFIGINSFIDIRNTIVKAEHCLPYLRAVKNIKDSTLPLGEITAELRLMSYLIHPNFDLEKEMANWKKKFKKVLSKPPFSRIRALISLLNYWYTTEENDDTIICLGVASNGTFGLPPRMVFSQPVKFDKDRNVWSPYSSIPMNDLTKEKISSMASEASEIIEELL